MKKSDLYDASRGVTPDPHLKTRLAAVVTHDFKRAKPRRLGSALASCALFLMLGAALLYINGAFVPVPGNDPGETVLSPGAGGDMPGILEPSPSPGPETFEIIIIYDPDLQTMQALNSGRDPRLDRYTVRTIYNAVNRWNEVVSIEISPDFHEELYGFLRLQFGSEVRYMIETKPIPNILDTLHRVATDALAKGDIVILQELLYDPENAELYISEYQRLLKEEDVNISVSTTISNHDNAKIHLTIGP
jgi:hypothetical protein